MSVDLFGLGLVRRSFFSIRYTAAFTVNLYFTLVSFNVRFPTFATDLIAFIVMPCFASELVGVITENIPDGDRLGVVVTRLT